jgi:hypothetical protein
MRSPLDVLCGRVNGLSKKEITRRTVPCFKHVVEPDGEKLEVCLLVDSKYLYRYPYERAKGTKSLAIKARFLKKEMEHLRLREFQPRICRYIRDRADSVAGTGSAAAG